MEVLFFFLFKNKDVKKLSSWPETSNVDFERISSLKTTQKVEFPNICDYLTEKKRSLFGSSFFVKQFRKTLNMFILP